MVVQFKNKQTNSNKKQPEKLPTAAERVANKILVGPIHKIQKPEPKLPPLKFANQHSERIQMDDIQEFYAKRNTLSLETIQERYIKHF